MLKITFQDGMTYTLDTLPTADLMDMEAVISSSPEARKTFIAGLTADKISTWFAAGSGSRGDFLKVAEGKFYAKSAIVCIEVPATVQTEARNVYGAAALINPGVSLGWGPDDH